MNAYDLPHTRPTRIPSLVSLRAAGALLTASSTPIRSASVTLPLHGSPGEALAVLRRAERFAHELGLRHRVEVGARTVTIHLWRQREH